MRVAIQGDGEHRPYPQTGKERTEARVGAMLAIALDCVVMVDKHPRISYHYGVTAGASVVRNRAF
jgi:hypothetical protein